MNPLNALCVLLEFEPCAPVGNDGGAVHLLAGLVPLHCVVRAGRTDELGDDDALRAVDYERARIGHEGEFAHEHVLFDYLFLYLVVEPDLDVQGKRICRISVAAFLFVVLGFLVEPMVEEIELVVVRIVHDGREIFEHFGNAFVYEGRVARFLDFNEVGDVDDFIDFAEFSSFGFAILVNG